MNAAARRNERQTMVAEWDAIKHQTGIYSAPTAREEAGYHLSQKHPIESFLKHAPHGAHGWWAEVECLMRGVL